jgi:DNA-binding NarL/FixJ family response regulator
MSRSFSPSLVAAPISLPANPKIVIIHAVPLLRLGMETALRAAPALSATEILGFAGLTEAAESLGRAGPGDAVIVDGSAWASLEQYRAAPQFARLRTSGPAFALITSADHGATRLLEARGISGVIAPDADADDLVGLATDLLAGRTCFPTAVAPLNAATGLARLSNRQFEILELMTRGLLNKQIAWELGLTEGTVKSHVSAILEKLGCDRRTQAIAAFMQSFGVGKVHAAVA